MRKYIVLILMMIAFVASAKKRNVIADSITLRLSPVEYYRLHPIPKRPWAAAAEVFGVDMISWSISKFVAKKPFANISLATMKRNIDTGFIWDIDEFPTNLVAHPYQGGLSFAASRAWGMTYLESLPYSFAGSFLWEMFLEGEPASINDLITTSIGGMAYGEVMHRVSSQVLNNRARGMNRVGRELGAFLIDPTRGVQRLVTGEMWKQGYPYVDATAGISGVLSLSAGYRLLMNNGLGSRYDQNAYVGLHYEYNDPYEVSGRTPFEYFMLAADFNLGHKQAFLGDIRISGLLFGETFSGKTYQSLLGVFQQYSFHDSKAISKIGNPESEVPYRISETAAFGLGGFWKKEIVQNLQAEGRGFLTGIMLGGYYSDYYRFGKRDYNFGSGFSFRASFGLTLANRLSLTAETEGYKLYTLSGYRDKLTGLSNALYLDAQGDPGSGFVLISRLDAKVRLYDQIRIGAKMGWYYRRNSYRGVPQDLMSVTKYRSNDIRFYLEYAF